MDHRRSWVLALGAVIVALAAFGLTASSALAVPEFGQCFVQPKHEGKYTNSVCTAKAKKVLEKFTGEFEWRKATEIEAAKKKFEGTGGKVILTALYRECEPSETVRAQTCHAGEEEETVGPIKIGCESEVNKGEITGTKNVTNVTVTFKGCETIVGFGGVCQSTATPGEIQLTKLKGALGFVSKKVTPREVGLQLEPATKKARWTTYKCSGGAEVLSFVIGEGNETEGCVYPQKLCGGDGIVSAITPVDTATATFTQVFTANEETAEEIPSKFEGKPLKELETYFFNTTGPATTMWSKAALGLTNTDKTPEALEIKSK